MLQDGLASYKNVIIKKTLFGKNANVLTWHTTSCQIFWALQLYNYSWIVLGIKVLNAGR